MMKAYSCVQGGGGFKHGEYVRISILYLFFQIFSMKKKNENDRSNGGFFDITSE